MNLNVIARTVPLLLLSGRLHGVAVSPAELSERYPIGPAISFVDDGQTLGISGKQ